MVAHLPDRLVIEVVLVLLLSIIADNHENALHGAVWRVGARGSTFGARSSRSGVWHPTYSSGCLSVPSVRLGLLGDGLLPQGFGRGARVPGVAGDIAPRRERVHETPQVTDAKRARTIATAWADFLRDIIGLWNLGAGRRFHESLVVGCFEEEVCMILAATPFAVSWLSSTRRRSRHSRCSADGPPTAGATFRGGVAFAAGFFDLDGAEEIVLSSRCRGAMCKRFAKKRARERTTPVCGAGLLVGERRCLGHGLPRQGLLWHMLVLRPRKFSHGRCHSRGEQADRRRACEHRRWLRRGQHYRSQVRSARWPRFFPLVGLSIGISGRPWARMWL